MQSRQIQCERAWQAGPQHLRRLRKDDMLIICGAGPGEGLITYMRTDSLQIGSSAITHIRKTVEQLHGPGYLPDTPRTYK